MGGAASKEELTERHLTQSLLHALVSACFSFRVQGFSVSD